MKRNPVPTMFDLCQYEFSNGKKCLTPYAQTHEVFFGTANRQKSIHHKMQIRLCDAHHKHAHDNKEYQNFLRQRYQHIFEQRCIDRGMSEEEARDHFRIEFGKSYL